MAVGGSCARWRSVAAVRDGGRWQLCEMAVGDSCVRWRLSPWSGHCLTYCHIYWNVKFHVFHLCQVYFEKQPQQVQKIYTYLTTLSNTSNVSVGDVCSAIVPLLKGNSLLVEHFMTLLPHEKPPERWVVKISHSHHIVADDSSLWNFDACQFEGL